MKVQARPRSTVQRVAIWAGLALACSGFAYCNLFSWYPAVSTFGVAFSRGLTWELLRWNLWLPLAAAILHWKRRMGFLSYAAAALLIPALHTILLVGSNWVLSPVGIPVMLHYRASRVLIPDYLTGIVICALVLGLAYARTEELRASRLEAQLAQAQLDALKMQLQPHFLFNTLNAISGLQMEDPEAAQQMIVRLADFLRMTLEESSAQQVSLEREVEFLARYLEIEKVRFPRRLTVEIGIDPEVRGALVPNLILQPIVENAIRHGISAKAMPGKVEIHAGRRNGSLVLSVRDSGPGNGGGPVCEGRGLSITRARLARMYGTDAHFSAGNGSGGGFAVAIEIPLVREVPA